MNIASLGKKLVFYSLLGDASDTLQIMGNQSMFESPEAFQRITNEIRRGFIVGVQGHPGRTKTKELSVFATSIITLAPCLRMMPDYKSGAQKSALQVE